MKKVLSLLMAFVFLHVQAHAISGGPAFGGTTGSSLVGTYAGVLTGPTNALGIFLVGIPEVGPSQGDFNIFINGTFYGGTIIGLADPLESTFRGVVQGTRLNDFLNFTSDFFGDNFQSGTIGGTAAGLVNAQITDGGGANAGLASIRLIGTAKVDVRERQPSVTTVTEGVVTQDPGKFKKVASIDFEVDGFKQSNEGNTQQAQILGNFGAGTQQTGG